MYPISLLKKAAKAVVRTVKDIIQFLKTSYEVKKAKVKAWHQLQKATNPDYINHLITILVATVKIFVPFTVAKAISASFYDGWDERY